MNTYQQKAANTKARRQAAGYYATAAHQAASSKLINRGMRSLTVEELWTLSTHPFYTVSQRQNFADLAAAME